MISVLYAAAAALCLSVVCEQHASAAPQCLYTPKLPPKLTVNQTVVGLRTPLAITGTGCAKNYDVSAELVHSTDSYFMMWDGHGPDVESVFASEIVPGRYHTTAGDCFSYDADYNELSCSVAPGSTMIKFGARARLTVTRKGSVVTFKAVATRYFDYQGFRPVRNTVLIQRLSAGKWVTIHRAVANRAAGYVWHYTHPRRASYRAVSIETASAWSGNSLTSTK